MKKAVILFIFILTVVCASAADVTLKDYPYFFVEDGLFNAKYVVGEEAPAVDTVSTTVLSTNLARFEDIKTAVGNSALDSDISNIHKVDAIVIGNPCINNAARQLEHNPKNCEEGLANSTGYIKLFSTGNKVQILITGISAEDRQIMAKKLAEGDLDNFNGDFFAYPTKTGSKSNKLIQQAAQNNIARPLTTTASSASQTENPILETKLTPQVIEPKAPTVYDRIDIQQHREKPGFFGRIWNSIISFFRN
jgi:hypothetical protein